VFFFFFFLSTFSSSLLYAEKAVFLIQNHGTVFLLDDAASGECLRGIGAGGGVFVKRPWSRGAGATAGSYLQRRIAYVRC